MHNVEARILDEEQALQACSTVVIWVVERIVNELIEGKKEVVTPCLNVHLLLH